MCRSLLLTDLSLCERLGMYPCVVLLLGPTLHAESLGCVGLVSWLFSRLGDVDVKFAVFGVPRA